MSDAAIIAKAAIRARHASSLLVLQGDGPAPEVLMGLRGAGHRFMPNRLVFPGGAVDRADATAAVAAPMPAHVQAMVERSCQPRLARALGVAAARELEEETSLTLGTPPDLSGFDYLGRAITPPDQPIRFNARFFVVNASAITGKLAGSGELEGLRFYGLEEALALELARPTRMVIGLLQRWLGMTPAQRAARTELPVFRLRKIVME